MQSVEPLLALERIAYLLELRGDPRYKVEAFRRAAAKHGVGALPPRA